MRQLIGQAEHKGRIYGPHTHVRANTCERGGLARPRSETLLGAQLHATYRLQVVKRKMLGFTGK